MATLLKFYCPRWGSEALPWNIFSDKVRSAGYDGVEVYPLQTPLEKPFMLQELASNGLGFSLLHAEMQEGRNFEKYLAALERNLYELAAYQTTTLKPQFITSQTGREYYTKDQMAACFALCERISQETSIPIFQETHRNKWSYAAHVVQQYLEDPAFAGVKLTLDFSHWVCVSESYLQDQEEAIDLAIARATHIHARVGHIEGPQVTHPGAPENNEALQHHLRWWDKWVAYLINNGVAQGTITPEFGAYPYMAKVPFTDEPIADQWALNIWMKNLLQERFFQQLKQISKPTPP